MKKIKFVNGAMIVTDYIPSMSCPICTVVGTNATSYGSEPVIINVDATDGSIIVDDLCETIDFAGNVHKW